MQSAAQGYGNQSPAAQPQMMVHEAIREKSFQPQAAAPVSEAPAATLSPNGWGIPVDFDTVSFLHQAKDYFVKLQGIWDRADIAGLRNLVTDDILPELTEQIQQSGGKNVTEVVLLNAELLGIETVSGGHLASVRFSGMLRENPGTEAFRFEEVWNLFKPTDGGWLLAGVQQVPTQQ
jgi:predicted lipid-binding transport protein (Tim44 family)